VNPITSGAKRSPLHAVFLPLQWWPALPACGAGIHANAFDLPGEIWLTSTEPIPEGGEIRIDYEGGVSRKVIINISNSVIVILLLGAVAVGVGVEVVVGGGGGVLGLTRLL